MLDSFIYSDEVHGSVCRGFSDWLDMSSYLQFRCLFFSESFGMQFLAHFTQCIFREALARKGHLKGPPNPPQLGTTLDYCLSEDKSQLARGHIGCQRYTTLCRLWLAIGRDDHPLRTCWPAFCKRHLLVKLNDRPMAQGTTTMATKRRKCDQKLRV